jgi:hypothetical protein
VITKLNIKGRKEEENNPALFILPFKGLILAHRP